MQVIRNMNDAQYCKHDKPEGHDRTKKLADKGGSELLDKKQYCQNTDNNIDNHCLTNVREGWHLL